MQKANTNAYDQRTDDVSQFVNVDKAQQIGALDGFTFSLAERIAKQSSERNFTRDVMSQAFTGTSPYQLMNNLETEAAMADQNAAKLENRRLKLQSDLAAMSPEQADDTNYRAALGAYEQMLRNIPQAPQLERFGFSDTDKMMIGFALLMGANPSDAIGKFVQTKMGFIDIQNRQTQDQFQIDQSLYRDQLRGLGDIVDIENQRLNRDQFSLDRQFGLQSQNINRELNAVNQAIDDQRLAQAQQDQMYARAQTVIDNQFKTIGEMTPDMRAEFERSLTARGLDLNRLVLPPVGTRTLGKEKNVFDQSMKNRQFDLNQRKFANAQEYQRRTMALRAVSTAMKALNDEVNRVDMTGEVTAADVEGYNALKQRLADAYNINPDLLPGAPKVGETWQVVVGKFNANMQARKFELDQEAAERERYKAQVLDPLQKQIAERTQELAEYTKVYNGLLADKNALEVAAKAKNATDEEKKAFEAANQKFKTWESARMKRNHELAELKRVYDVRLNKMPKVSSFNPPPAPSPGGGQPAPLGGNLPAVDGTGINPADPNNVTQDFNFNATDEKVKKETRKDKKKVTKPAAKTAVNPRKYNTAAGPQAPKNTAIKTEFGKGKFID